MFELIFFLFLLCLQCTGYWSDTAYGQMGLFKSDWKRIGGFDLKRYTTNWGGEDEDIVSK